MRNTLAYALLVTIVLTVWAVAYQFACDRELEVAQRLAVIPPTPEEFVQLRAEWSLAAALPPGPTTAPTTCLTPDDFEFDD